MLHPNLRNRYLEPAKFEALFTVTDGGSSNHTSSVYFLCLHESKPHPAFSPCILIFTIRRGFPIRTPPGDSRDDALKHVQRAVRCQEARRAVRCQEARSFVHDFPEPVSLRPSTFAQSLQVSQSVSPKLYPLFRIQTDALVWCTACYLLPQLNVSFVVMAKGTTCPPPPAPLVLLKGHLRPLLAQRARGPLQATELTINQSNSTEVQPEVDRASTGFLGASEPDPDSGSWGSQVQSNPSKFLTNFVFPLGLALTSICAHALLFL
ncbi:uncharacterized protein LACBIDRAFT_334220 [Laccaria bicolor S238N-H82]|uniref:Predicted protein n=1 Tax=Laccaria bicolor (strain S238N-H82 / ATCC MYA-4686) TaxID=486041 RepID=B0DYI0_LACBS|nr:uncharacterized protein LACBIDRAFT_334220 [Laccaria bicolor S238N-H82]EDR00440.1 predicted protein [Laccaria bicolor S238N-H82]|eukprot:XP_001888999.1 predicted protein [Laccaria bicolor S238N-H82]